MSRIGKKPIDVPKGVDITVADGIYTVKGPKGTLTREFRPEIAINIEGNVINVTRSSDEKSHRAFHGLTRTLLYNMILGVTEGFEKKLDINGVGYRALKQGTKLVLTLGYSHPVEMEEPNGITIEVPAQNKIIVKGIDKQQVGEIASQIRGYRKPEPYKGKGIKYDYEVIKRKEGKTGAKK